MPKKKKSFVTKKQIRDAQIIGAVFTGKTQGRALRAFRSRVEKSAVERMNKQQGPLIRFVDPATGRIKSRRR